MAPRQSSKPTPMITPVPAVKKSKTSTSQASANEKMSRFMMATNASKQAEINTIIKSIAPNKLSSSVVVAKKGHGGVTIPEPFHFTSKNKTNDKLVGSKSPVMSLAVQARLFEANGLRSSTVSTSKVFSQSMKLTVAKSPKFHAIHKRTSLQPTEEKEVSMVASKPAFKHNPVNKKVDFLIFLSHLLIIICQL